MTTAEMKDEAHKWRLDLARQANNRGWQLAEDHGREPEYHAEMLDAAHASAWLWSAVGNEINRMRAQMLLAQVHALVGDGARALAYASEMRDFFVGHVDTPDWELAFAHVIFAHAAQVAGRRQPYVEAYALAKQAVAAIAEDEDRAIVMKTFAQVPAP
ncbi:MAG: hypothetical protein HY854_24145 [Burkholderiales bacterium]|nr:hypothetical protein [Burkholderiales bacterium]